MPNIFANKTYKEGVTLLTPTGDRQIALSRCEFYMKRQSYSGPLQWLVADDGWPWSRLTAGQEHLQRQPSKDKAQSFLNNIRSMLLKIKYNNIFIIEDDDWYHSNYIELYFNYLQNYELVGETPSIYYNLKHNRWRSSGNNKRASLCQTAFKACLLQRIEKMTYSRNAFLDARIWKFKCKKKLFKGKNYCIGIKGLPGRKGIGIGHRPGHSFKFDPDWIRLTNFIGKEDVEWYKNLRQSLLPEVVVS